MALVAKTPPNCDAPCIVLAPSQRDMHAALIRAASLSLLKESALNALFSVVAFAVQ